MKNETHEDRRVRKTKRSLRDCLVRLMKAITKTSTIFSSM